MPSDERPSTRTLQPMLTRDFLDERLVPELDADTVQYYDHIRRYLFAQQFVQGKRTADIACGTAYGSVMLQQAGATSVIGVDLSSDALRYAIRRPDRHGSEVLLVQADGLKLPLQTGSIDVVVSFETVEHIPTPEQFLNEIRRILSPGGLLIVSVPNRAVASPGSDTPFSPYHAFEPTLSELKTLITANGFHLRALHGMTHSIRSRSLLRGATGKFSRQPRIIAWSAYLRRTLIDLIPPILYQRIRQAPPLSISDSILTDQADEHSSYFVCVCALASD